MNGRNILVDSNIVINFMNGDSKNLTLFANNRIFLSIISVIEIISANFSDEEVNKIKEFIASNFEVIYLTDKKLLN